MSELILWAKLKPQVGKYGCCNGTITLVTSNPVQFRLTKEISHDILLLVLDKDDLEFYSRLLCCLSSHSVLFYTCRSCPMESI